jgi:hypothetical protein
VVSWKKRLGWALVLLVAAVLLVWGVRLAQAGLSLRKHLAQAQELAQEPGGLDPAGACALVRDLQGDVGALDRRAGGLIRFAPRLGWLPGVGGDLRAAPHFVSVAQGLAEAGAIVCDALDPALAALEGEGEGADDLSLEHVARLLDEGRPELGRAHAAVEGAQTAWAQVEVETLSPWLAERVAMLDQGLPLLRAGLDVAGSAPYLLGVEVPQTYLILAQNEDELRPTGGFISGAGRITLDGGRIVELDFQDANYVDDYAHKPYPEPPGPLLDYMGSELWLLRDANWSPDFPTSARQAAYLYEYGQGVPVDGVVALDQRAVELVMAGMGQVAVPGVEEPVSAANVRQFLRAAWNPGEAGVTREWLYSRKEFIGNLAAAIRQRVERDPGSVDWVRVGQGLYRALEERHLLVFVKDADVAQALARTGWDGRLRESAGDYLMVVDSNLGFGKVNPLIREALEYRVTLYADGTAAAALSLAYAHQGSLEGVRCRHPLPYVGDLTYEEMMHRCYYDYLRAYVPAGSVLRAATSHPTPGRYLLRGEPDPGQAVTLDDDAGKTVFGQFFVVEYGQTLETRLVYDLPPVTWMSEGQRHYALLIQKQPGTDGVPILLTVALPPGARLASAAPSPSRIDGETLTFELELAIDVVVEIAYE